jgi:hypothetical protein
MSRENSFLRSQSGHRLLPALVVDEISDVLPHDQGPVVRDLGRPGRAVKGLKPFDDSRE